MFELNSRSLAYLPSHQAAMGSYAKWRPKVECWAQLMLAAMPKLSPTLEFVMQSVFAKFVLDELSASKTTLPNLRLALSLWKCQGVRGKTLERNTSTCLSSPSFIVHQLHLYFTDVITLPK